MIKQLQDKYGEALTYHKGGKISVQPSKKLLTKYDLSLAYSPGVAIPCVEIQNDPETAYTYTTKSNLVGVISNGTAVLGLGNIGALASKPVMEGKAILFKSFANINAFDIEVNETDPDKFIEVVKAIAPTFGGINLEDIKAPDCFYIEERLKAELDIPVMHDDQHGTAIIASAALINALDIGNKKIEECKIVVLGAGAAAIACGKMYKKLGAQNVHMVDSKGLVTTKRQDLNQYKLEFAVDSEDTTLTEAIKDADVILGLSKGNLITEEMLKTLAPNPIIFALSNPIPEVSPELVEQVRPDAIMATGRSDYPNQVNNVLGFPYIFRGALDVNAHSINDEMMIAAVRALSDLAKKDVPGALLEVYDRRDFTFGKGYLIPLPFDKRLMEHVSCAVAFAAIESGVARKTLDAESYRCSLQEESMNA